MPKMPCVGMPFNLTTRVNVDLTRAVSFAFWYELPDGTTGTVVAVQLPTRPGFITGLIPSSVNTHAGEWRARLLITWDYDPNPARGKIAKFVVNEANE